VSHKRVTFGQIHCLLTEYGFVRRTLKGKGVIYENDSEDLIAFRPHRLNENVDATYLSMIRMRLDWYGLLEREKFDEALEKVAAKQAAKRTKKPR